MRQLRENHMKEHLESILKRDDNEILLENYKLLCNLVAQRGESNQYKVDLSKVEDFINNKISEKLRNYTPDEFDELFTNFKSEYEKFRDFTVYDKLIGKSIVAIGGEFSTGKSSFLNTLMKKPVLPADIEPSTSVPTYIVRGETHEVVGINIFDTKIRMEPKDIRKISYGLELVGDDEQIADEVTLGHILESLCFSTPLHKYDNIAFLDTPGYSKTDSEHYSAKTDEQVARGQLNSSDYILWFIQPDTGTIIEEDIKFLKTLREDIPKVIVVNKADKENLSDLKKIIDKTRTTLNINGVRYVDVFAFTSRLERVKDEELKKYIKENKVNLKKQIKEWNAQV